MVFRICMCKQKKKRIRQQLPTKVGSMTVFSAITASRVRKGVIYPCSFSTRTQISAPSSGSRRSLRRAER